jgi:hypothetical protein
LPFATHFASVDVAAGSAAGAEDTEADGVLTEAAFVALADAGGVAVAGAGAGVCDPPQAARVIPIKNR